MRVEVWITPTFSPISAVALVVCPAGLRIDHSVTRLKKGGTLTSIWRDCCRFATGDERNPEYL
jgi:hypothetical protein